jgi:hypothetical protein
VTLLNTLDSSRGRVDSEQVTTTYTFCEGEPRRVPDLSVRSLTCTGSGDGTSGFGPLGPTASAVTPMGSFSTKLRRWFWWPIFPCVFLGGCASQR